MRQVKYLTDVFLSNICSGPNWVSVGLKCLLLKSHCDLRIQLGFTFSVNTVLQVVHKGICEKLKHPVSRGLKIFHVNLG